MIYEDTVMVLPVIKNKRITSVDVGFATDKTWRPFIALVKVAWTVSKINKRHCDSTTVLHSNHKAGVDETRRRIAAMKRAMSIAQLIEGVKKEDVQIVLLGREIREWSKERNS